MKKVLLTASVQSHIAQFHRPLIKILKQQGYVIHVAARNNLDEKNGLSIKNVDKIYEVPFQRFPLDPRNLIAYRKLRKLLKIEKYDLVSCNTPAAGVFTRLAARDVRISGTKVFYTAHGFHFYKGAPRKNWLLYYPIERLMAHFTDKLITITKEDYRLAKANFACEVDHIYGVGIDDSRYTVGQNEKAAQFRNEYAENASFVILCVGELNKNKNQLTVIRAVSEIIRENTGIMLWLAGNGPYEEILRDEIEKLNLQDHVRLLGYRTDLENFTGSCDILVSASFREGLPLNLLEAMACGKPVIASVNRGHRELVRTGYNGLLFDAENVQELKNHILTLMKSPGLRKKFTENGFKVVEKYKAGNVEKELRRIYLQQDANR